MTAVLEKLFLGVFLPVLAAPLAVAEEEQAFKTLLDEGIHHFNQKRAAFLAATFRDQKSTLRCAGG